MTYAIILSVFAVLLAIFYKYVRYKQSYWKRSNVTQVDPTFLLGNFTENYGKVNQLESYDQVYKQYKDTDRVLGLYMFMTPQLLVLDPELVKDICVKRFSDFHDTSFAHFCTPEADPLLSRNPFFLAGQEWKEKRAEITPAFSPARIKAMFPLVEDICVRIEKYLTNKQGESVEARDLCSRYTVDVVSNCIFGADAESFLNEKPEIWAMAKSIFVMNFWTQIRFMVSMFLPVVAKFFRLGFIPMHVNNYFSNLMGKAVEQRRQLGITRQDYLDYLLQMQGKKKISDMELAANAITFFTDGFDTSSVAIACTLLELARNKDIQIRLRKELESVSTYDELIDNEYMDLVFHEALRLHPPGAFTARECTISTEIELGAGKQLKVNVGDSIFIPIWSFHHDATIYEDPETFIPDRFANGELKRKQDEGLYLTFGSGPRTCIGQKFARAQSKACISTIIKNFEVELDDTKTQLPLKLEPKEFLTYYSGGVWLRFKKLSA